MQTIAPNVIITTPSQLKDAFNEWLRRYEEAPETFPEAFTGTYGEDCAAFLIDILKSLNIEAA